MKKPLAQELRLLGVVSLLSYTAALCLLSFDTERMGYAALYGGGEQFFFVDAAVFKSTGGDLYAISGAPYLTGVSGSSAHPFSGLRRHRPGHMGRPEPAGLHLLRGHRPQQ